MCDTIVATGSATEDGVTLFGKNSDREPNEAQYICHVPAGSFDKNTQVQCTYLKIPQAEKTYAALLSRPFWMWGAEMGVNEFGVAIGNEAVFTKIPYIKKQGLTGMDLVRLGLERGRSSIEALKIITGLMEIYGQGGNCGYQNKMYYHNSFIIADPDEAWLLETAGKHWAALKIDGVYSISNRLTIEKKWDLLSDDLISYAVQKGWCKSENDFSFSRCYSDTLYSGFSFSRYRRNRSMKLLNEMKGKIKIADFIRILRDHGEHNDPPHKGMLRSNICNHAGAGPVRISQTTGSIVSYLAKEKHVHFVTGTAAPCTSIFKPLWVDTGIPEYNKTPEGTFDEEVLFWKHEILHRKTISNYENLIELYNSERDKLENEFIKKALNESGKSKILRRELVANCFKKAHEAEERWLLKIQNKKFKKYSDLFYKLAWKKFNKLVKMSMC